MSTTIAQLIAYHRRRSGLSQQQLAALAGVGKNLIYELEKGKQTVRLENLLSVLRVLNIELEFRSPLMTAFHRELADAKS
ncbi:helix-turn-helix transcriptional regulator [Desulfoprunum benzoelyticum]|uniref:Y4mF family transcriptional regulator n=1 Tax=Desulfoprunum benzoelyticum TaxID=1506996 RepID=A0A840UVU8_9BACT|nr:type II toxin-antitoxin system Y4mF family antitoxin [Desulfoprunum benzoelyticum]MBB5347524.1 y4mF family transcriptional regulator [Desulfoprunum benzoelyticum]MBM9531916.1 helix-turn-helix transcriptional regulator [Desulfoprunum benzoelyticum]